MRYFKITCHRGHCGTGHSSAITFVFEAKNLIAAMDMAKRMPSVKHSRVIMSGNEISKEEYKDYIAISAYKRAEMMRA